jgi:resuscitation-promoting factor RpfA
VKTGPVRRMLAAPRARGLALTISALVVLSAFCRQLGTSTQAAWQSVLEPGPASTDQAAAAICGSVALALALWLLCAVLLSLLAALGSRSSGLGGVLTNGACLLAPRMLRNAVAALLGVAIVATPAVADASGPATNGGATVTGQVSEQLARRSKSVSDPELSPAWVPTTTASTPAPTASPATATISPSHPSTSPAAARPFPATTSARATTAPDRATSDTRAPFSPAGSPTAAERAPAARSSGPFESRKQPPAPMTTAPLRPYVDPDDEIVVRRGDTLWSLAERHLGPGATDGEIAVEWPHWFRANRAVIGHDPDHLLPGERLRPPQPDHHRQYRGHEQQRHERPDRRHQEHEAPARSNAQQRSLRSDAPAHTRGVR